VKDVIQGLEPQRLWEHFYEIAQIPRCSKHEEKIRDYVISVAKRNGADYKVDSVGNIVIRKPATPGKENKPIVVLQSHLDMVCEKNKDVAHDFSKDPIQLKREGDWMMARGTTLGADNGIGAAAALAVLESPDISHGPLELLFTVDEETGLTGATGLGSDMLEGRILLNLDSEEDGAIYIGCAGGRDTEFFLKLQTEAVPTGYAAVMVVLGGLQGGHSGLNIHEGRGNAIKLLARFLWKVAPELGFRLAAIEGGNKHNAIPREADAIGYLPSDKVEQLVSLANTYQDIFRNEYQLIDKDVRVTIRTEGFQAPEQVFSEDFQFRLLNMLYAMPHGVISMSLAVPGLVETSTNLAVIKTEADRVRILTSQRSSVESRLDEICEMVSAVGKLVQAEIRHGDGYPAWQPNPDSHTLKLAKQVYRELYGKEPEVKAVHAGLETGIIGDKFPGMDMISFGPTILGAHSPDERVQISTVKKFWDFMVALLEKLAA